MNSEHNNKQLVSIGLPVYNGGKFIRQAIDSLLAQDYKNIELIISDNASNDQTQQICMEYAAQDKRVRYYRSNINKGACWNFNHVFERSTAEYFMWASHDDYWKPSYISVCLKTYESPSDILLSGTLCESFDPKGERKTIIDQGLTTTGLSPQKRFIQYKNNLHNGKNFNGIFYGIYKSEFLSKVMPMQRVIAGDHLILADLSLFGEFITTKEKLIHKRWGGASKSHRANANAQGINNELLIQFPYFVREILLQKIIFRNSNLILSKKIKLSYLSLLNYSFIDIWFMFRMVLFLVKNIKNLINRKLG